MKYSLHDLIDIGQFQSLQDKLNEIYSFPSAIIDNDGNILTATGWQDICTRFHRVNAESEKECRISDQYIASHIHEANPAVSYKCPHGLIDNATPIIIDGIHYGIFFTGQFFLDPPDIEFFRKQAARYGFDEEAYLEAVKKVPVWNQDQLNNYLFFIRGLIEVISGIGLKNLKEIESNSKLNELSLRNEAILSSVPDIIMEVDNQKVYTWANQSGYNFFGDDVIGKEASNYFLGEQETYHSVQPLFNGRSDNLYVESWQRRKDGQRRLLAWWCHSLKDSRGNNMGALSTARDVTEERKAQEELMNSKALYQDLVETAQDLIWQCDPEGRYTYLNPAWEVVFGYKVEEMLGKRFSDFQAGEWAELDNKEFARLLKGSDIKGLETVHLGKDGREINLIFNAKYVQDAAGRIIGARGTAFDVTERKRSMEALLESEQRLRLIIDNAPFGAHHYELHSNGQLIFIGANKAADSILRVDNQQFTGKTIEAAFPSLSRTQIPEAYKAVARTGKSFSIEQVDYDENGIIGAFEVSAVQTASNRIAAFFRDITERKKYEEQLLIAKQHAEESDRLKSAFLANMSHEIRTPMNGILGFAELLKEPDLSSDEQSRYLEIIELSGERMLNLINNLIDIAKIEAGQMEVSPSKVNLDEIIRDSITFFKPEAGRKGLQLVYGNNSGDNGSIIETDREKVNAILTNLIKNAIKYTNEGMIELGYRNIGNAMEVYVRDTGIGIAEDRVSVIFNRFVQADIADRQAREGAGLGLSIARAYMDLLGGTIWVESELGKGSVFYFTLPYSLNIV